MKKFLLCLCMATMTMVAMAQENWQPMRWQGFETNRFWDNWEVSLGGGNSFLQLSQKWGEDPGSFLDRNGWNVNAGFLKWVAPTIGMRLQLDAGEFRNYAYDSSRFGNGAFNTPYLFVHGDIMINMSNWIGGYKPDRVYYAISYMGFGYTAMSWTKGSAGSYNGEFAFTSGLLNKFRITPQWDIELDLRSWLFAERSLPEQIRSGGRYAFSVSASIGVAYRFNQRDWEPGYPEVEVDGYLAAIFALEQRLATRDEELMAATDELDKLASSNNDLAMELEQLKSAAPQPMDIPSVESIAFFTIGDATIGDYAQATLESYVSQAKLSSCPISVVGYADKETGSAERNEELSMERAKAVTEWLVSHGIDASRISTSWVGDTEEAFTTPDTPIVNRCVIIREECIVAK
ncbi:MAG: OmpA family protein [Alistipes sp.]|nr:OmpA family protein [Alistipes sp.]